MEISLENRKKILEKLEVIMNSLSHVAKNMLVEFGTTSYRAVTEEAVLNAVRPLFLEQHLTMLPGEIHSVQQFGKITILGMIYHLSDSETGAYIQIPSVGGGHDSSDKGPGKAYTYSLKYAIIKSLMLAQGNDPDKSHSNANVDADQKATAETKTEFDALVKLLDDYVEEGFITATDKVVIKSTLTEAKADPGRLENARKYIESAKPKE